MIKLNNFLTSTLGDMILELLHQDDNFTTFLFDFLDRLSTHQHQTAAMLLWSIWKSRNTKLWESCDTTTAAIISREKDTLHEWSCMQRVKPQVHTLDHSITWVKLQEGALTCNVDAAIFQNNIMAGYGIFFRNSMGQFLMGKSAFSTSSGSVLEAEASALFEALKLAVSRVFQSVHFETDNKTLVDAVNSNSIHLNGFGDLVSQCRYILSTNTDFRVSYIRR